MAVPTAINNNVRRYRELFATALNFRAGIVDEKRLLFSSSAAQRNAPRSFDSPENYGHVSWAAPNMLIGAPRSGFIAGVALPARIVAVPEKPGTH